MTFGEVIKEVRKALKMTQEQFAHDLGVSFSALSRWENGRTTPRLMARRTILMYCKEKGVSEELLAELEQVQE